MNVLVPAIPKRLVLTVGMIKIALIETGPANQERSVQPWLSFRDENSVETLRKRFDRENARYKWQIWRRAGKVPTPACKRILL